MSDAHEAKQATPHALLLAELLDSRIPKSEREHAAKQEIERLRAERDELRRQLAEAQKELHNLNWALGTEGYDQMATPEEQAEHEAAVRAHYDVLARLEEGQRTYEAMKRDARRYRDWLRGGANIPPESTRWARWEVRYWDGRHWNALFAEQMDAAIDAAMGVSDE